MTRKQAPERVAENVRTLAKAANITQAAMARALHTTQQTISRKLSGETSFRLEELDAIADTLHTTPDLLVTRNPTKE